MSLGITDNSDEDLIIIHVGHLTDEQYEKVAKSVIAFMNQRWPDVRLLGRDN